MQETLDQFTRRLSDSGLMSAEQLEQFCDTLPADQKPNAADQLGRRLIENNVLTEFQVNALSTGGPDPLVIGDYVILEKLGEGGMGVVFKARHRLMKRIVAIKKLSARAGNDDSVLRRFEREVEISASLNHRNIVAALDAREIQGCCYLVMEYVEGRSLSQLVSERGTLPIDTAIDYTIQAATACAHAHALGVIHRDIKPSNMLVDSDGVVRILDMGLARAEFRPDQSFASTERQLTSTGIIIGTLDYMSPEQALNARSADHRTDIYSLGCTLYFLLTGGPVYTGETPMETLVAHREQPIPLPSDRRSEIDGALDGICTRMLAKAADDRFQTMTDVIQELQSCQQAPDGPVAVAPDTVTDVNHAPAPAAARDPVTAAVVDELPVEPSTATESGTSRPTSPAGPQPSRSGLFGGLIRTPVVVTGHVLGAVIGGFVGAEIGGLLGVFPAILGAVAYVWFGWYCGGGYAWMIAWRQGWTSIPPEAKVGPLFAFEKLKRHAAAIVIGGVAGTAILSTWTGIYIGLTVLAITDRVHHQ